MTVLPITLTIAAAAALLNLWIASRAVAARYPQKILIGDGGNEVLAARMRAHANFSEYTPLFLILLGLIELAEGPMIWLWIVAILYIVARILHVFGLDRTKPNALRAIGFMVSFLATLVLAIYALTIPYRHKSMNTGITYVSADQARASTLSATNGLVRRS
jgi:uncharacterized membrane protein YecN with MAPEG domain